MKVRVILQEIQNKENVITMYNDIFNKQNGIAFFPIDKEKWEILRIDRCTNMFDKHNNEIYENDKVVCTYSNKTMVEGIIIYDSFYGCFSLDVDEEDKIQLSKFRTIYKLLNQKKYDTYNH